MIKGELRRVKQRPVPPSSIAMPYSETDQGDSRFGAETQAPIRAMDISTSIENNLLNSLAAIHSLEHKRALIKILRGKLEWI